MKTELQLDYADARSIADACGNESIRTDVPVSIAVLDPAGHLLLMVRFDGASFQTPEVARGKALTSVMMRKSSKAIEDATLSRPTLGTFNDGRLPIQGGMPIFANGVCIGAVGVSGGTPEQDESIAQAGVDAFSRDNGAA
ncbi:heme-binding protein [Sodalis sp. dw_96]|uniref:GlcG/HbpS family heme-binding protein n=1 Tax=Sodalis sp. dw_96 TaxID=2719794 RepID=UPI001BD619F7|nr:heme-binding protein [Sodalis sp. dw_96]